MKLFFCGNAYKYECEAVMKIFLPAQSFEFYYEEVPAGNDDFAFLRKRTTRSYELLYVWAKYCGKSALELKRLPRGASDDDCEEELSRLLYRAMHEITGISSQWGVLTGVRPVKRVRKFMEQGLGKDEIISQMRSRYFVSEKKSLLAYETACTQKPFLDELKAKQGRTFGLYISIPFCPTRCAYCSFISQSAQGKAVQKLIPAYIENLCEEIKYTASITESLGIKADTVYFGGGTPTTLSAAQLTRIMNAVRENFDLSAVREYTIEAGRPDTVTAEKLEVIKAAGCTRISVNPQTLNDDVLKTIGRSHTAADFFDSFGLARKMGFDSINTDVIAGLPSDTLESFTHTIDELIKLAPESITVHTLAVKRSAKLNSDSDKIKVLKNPARAMVDLAEEKLLQNGYIPYYLYRQKNMVENLENIGWVKPGYESLYNIYIMEEVQNIIALGAAASTKIILDGDCKRIFNYKYPLDYNANFQLMLERKKQMKQLLQDNLCREKK